MTTDMQELIDQAIARLVHDRLLFGTGIIAISILDGEVTLERVHPLDFYKYERGDK